MDRPFREVHELYRILYLRAEAQQKAEEERAKKEAEEAKRQNQMNRPKGIPNMPTMSADVNKEPELSPPMPPIDPEDLEDVLEELI